MLQSAVAEAQRCFAAPLDHTRQKVQPELMNMHGDQHFDVPLRSDVSLRCPPDFETQTYRRGKTNFEEVSLQTTTMPNGCLTAHAGTAKQRETSSFNVVVVDRDGQKVNTTHRLPVLHEDHSPRRSWQAGSVLEVFSSSGACWHPALVMEVLKHEGKPDMLTVQFWLDIDDAKKKTLRRNDEHLAPLGTNCGGQLPPGFQQKASKSRAGVSVFMDATTGLRYETADLAWAAHFRRWLEHLIPAGIDTIRSVKAVVDATAPSTQSMQSPKAPGPQATDMDSEVAQGLATEYELSREAPRIVSMETQRSFTQERPSAPIGLVTEYESDWLTVPQAAAAECRQNGNPGMQLQPGLMMTVPNPRRTPSAPIPQHSAPHIAPCVAAAAHNTSTPVAPAMSGIPMYTTPGVFCAQEPSMQCTSPVGLVTVP
jgi:hypothetical protein